MNPLGWDAAWEAARREIDPDTAMVPVRIAAEHRGAYHAMGDGGTAWVELTGKAYAEARDKRALPTVGDWILVERWTEALAGSGAATIRHILPRRSFLVRRAAGEATVPQPLAANVDTGLVMTSANADLSPARIDRYVSLLRDGGITPVIVLSKADLVADPAPVASTIQIGVRVIPISVVTGVGLDEIHALGGPGRTCVLLGSSGVGKSSLLNALLGTAQETREIRADARGRHTTTRRELFVAGDGGLWIDTPGMRELAQWIDDGDEVVDAFDDISELASACRFRDCKHEQEPGCAVRGKITAARLASFHKLAVERHAATAKQDAAQKLAESRRSRVKKPRRPPDDA
ncbi:MAG: ribosome small subunit-dependent GTPase A [Kofleriaceae bacterium]